MLPSSSRALGNVAEQDFRDHGDVVEHFQNPWCEISVRELWEITFLSGCNSWQSWWHPSRRETDESSSQNGSQKVGSGESQTTGQKQLDEALLSNTSFYDSLSENVYAVDMLSFLLRCILILCSLEECLQKWPFGIPRNTEFYTEVISIPRNFNSPEFRVLFCIRNFVLWVDR